MSPVQHPADENETNHWAGLGRNWAQVGPPLRPSEEDLALYSSATESWSRTGDRPRVVILGVTPELYRLPWPPGTDIHAIDHTQEMIDKLWPGPAGSATCVEWSSIPMPDGSRDIALCDGGTNMLSYPGGQSAMVRSLARLLAPGGLAIMRVFLPPAETESPESILGDLLSGRVANLNALKLRIWTALQTSPEQGIALHEVWSAVHRVAPDLDRLARDIGWPTEHMRVLDVYRNSQSRYAFPTADQIISLLCENPGGFTLQSATPPPYELGDRCPTIVFRRT